MEREEFSRQLRQLESVITNGVGFFGAWSEIADLDDASAHALNRYRGFFLPVQLALRQMALLQFAKVFDKDRRAISLHNMLHAARTNRAVLLPHASDGDLATFQSRVAANEDLLNRLKDHRDQRLAHHDHTVSTGKPVLYGEFSRLVEDVIDVYNSLTKWHSRSTTSFQGISRQAKTDTAEVKRIIREEKERVRSRLDQSRTDLGQRR